RGTVPEPTLVTSAPALDRRVAQTRTVEPLVIVSASGDRRGRGDPRDGHGGRGKAGRAVSELAVGVRTPAAHGPIAEESARVVTAPRDGRRVRDSAHQHRSRLRQGRTVSELTIRVVAPANDLASRDKLASVTLAHGEQRIG